MNQATNAGAYLPLGQKILRSMGLTAASVAMVNIQVLAVKAKGSLRDFTNDVVLAGIKAGGTLPA